MTQKFTSAIVAIFFLSSPVRLVAQQKVQPEKAWMLWEYFEVSTSGKRSSPGWYALETFEDLKSCKAEATRMAQKIAGAMEENRLELKAGEYFQHIQEWLCLPGGTNPEITVRPGKESQ
jgi:hypothetical protein